MAGKKTTPPKAATTGAEKAAESLEQLSKLSREELLIKLGQLMAENAALRKTARAAAETTEILRTAADKYLRQPHEDTMKDYED